MPLAPRPQSAPGGMFDPLVLAKLGRLSLLARTVVEGVIAGLHRSPYRGFSLEFTSHRAYSPGDEIRRIDWKAYGRIDRYFIKEYEEETNLKAYLLVDGSASMGYGRAVSKLRHASLLACSLSYLLLRQRDSVGLAVYRESLLRLIPARSTFNHLEVLAGELEGLTPAAGTDTARAVEALAQGLRRRSLIIVISDLLDDPDRLGRALKQLRHRKHDVIVFQVLDGDELELPFNRQTLFLDPESDLKVATNPADIRSEYRAILGEYLERIRHLCHSTAIDYALLSTAEPLDRSLVRFLSRRMGR
jgi:uncharacterized protein (DUF58 family)